MVVLAVNESDNDSIGVANEERAKIGRERLHIF